MDGGLINVLAVLVVLLTTIAAIAAAVRRPKKAQQQLLQEKEQARALRARGQATEHPLVWTAMTVGIATVLLYGLTISVAVDAVDDIVIRALLGTDKVNVILALYFVVLGLAFAMSLVATFRSARGIAIATFSLWAGGISALVIEAGTVIAMVPGFPFTWNAFLLVPAVFTYLAAPAGFLVLQAALFITFMTLSSKISRIE